MKLIIAPLARLDLLEIGDYIASDNIPRAETFVSELMDRCESLLNAPLSGRPRYDLLPGFRSVPYGRYVIFYTLSDAVVRIERILHGARNLAAIFDNDN
ncbi:hypothetical protein ABAC460_22335 [Asticcacaulis sp. AC460]|uniref:type II toxin-antitoxin system RelE/ParE family toxin n=1 Tax=Asticcacaulis sp. AC460 TaxID=1282360 RepID=UPI0003C409EF|nr:type II toxin-antitoxin system RelE/ParE family toxin [Asticcacaulis sp. AC460]ESQ86792.1 hypothetical protein ABAC460_22335 [Asticcacaulis sp. AC460]